MRILILLCCFAIASLFASKGIPNTSDPNSNPNPNPNSNTNSKINLSVYYKKENPADNTSTEEADKKVFYKLFSDWTDAFNSKNLDKTCALFSKDLQANYQGAPPKTYSSICDGFKQIFQDRKKVYQYGFNINQVYRTQNFAAVRITWYLSTFENEMKVSMTQDEGLDILKQNENGDWQIINYLGYPVSTTDVKPFS